MQFSQETDYALRLVDFFARQKNDDFSNAKELSESLSIPYRFLLRVLGKLKRGGVLLSRMGEKGGYRLARPPAQITLGQVVALIEGDVPLVRCMQNTAFCNAAFAPGCRVHKAMHKVQGQLREILNQYTFDSLET